VARLAPLTVVLFLALTGSALGANATVTDGQLRYFGSSGEVNGALIDLTEAGDQYRIRDITYGRDAIRLSAGPGCGVGNDEILCARDGVTRIAIALGDRDDRISIGDLPVPLTLSGGDGRDVAQYFLKEWVGLTVTADDLADDGPQRRDNIGSDIETLSGGPFADALTIGPRGGGIGGGAGDDRLTGGAGDDVVHAAYVEDVGTESGSFYLNGSDTIKCGGGQDFVYADSTDRIDPDCEAYGRDVPGGGGFEFQGSSGPDRISVPYGWEPSVVFGRGGNDLLISGFAGAQRIVGGAGNDRIQGGGTYHSPRQRLEGGSGNDRIRARDPGKGYRDLIFCGPGRDHAIVDRLDSVSGCERVSRSR
jgi:Ca2+-binding RTX toxin-like protein